MLVSFWGDVGVVGDGRISCSTIDISPGFLSLGTKIWRSVPGWRIIDSNEKKKERKNKDKMILTGQMTLEKTSLYRPAYKETLSESE